MSRVSAPVRTASSTMFSSWKLFADLQLWSEPHAQILRGDEHPEVEVLQRQQRVNDRCAREPIEPSDDQRTQRVLGRVRLKVGREARRRLARVREDEHLATTKRREPRRGNGARRLHLDLLRDQRLERLVALGLVILHRRASERRALAAHRARAELARGRVSRLIVHRRL